MNPFVKLKEYAKGIFEKTKEGVKSMTEKKMWFEEEIGKPRYKERINRVEKVDSYLAREHKVLNRPDFDFKGKSYETAKVVLNTLKSILKFHSGYMTSNPVSLTGDKELVSVLNKIYKIGNYNKRDMQIAKELLKYGDAFEYVYLDENENIQSKVINNRDSYPLYDGNGNYNCFVESWKDEDTSKMHYIVYHEDVVEIYEDNQLVDTKMNLTGLPIWYSSMEKTVGTKFGDPFIFDLTMVQDTIENLLSKLDDAVTTLSLNPLGVVSGQRVDGAIPEDVVGVILNLEEGASFDYATVSMDKESIKLELDYLIQQFYAIANVPASVLGNSNIANVSETSLGLLYQQTDNFCKEYITVMVEGMHKRLEYIRALMEIKGIKIEDEVFDSINISFNVNRPVDNKSDMENMKMQYECGAMSRQTIIDKSPYTTDTALEIQRIEEENGQKVEKEIEIDEKVD